VYSVRVCIPVLRRNGLVLVFQVRGTSTFSRGDAQPLPTRGRRLRGGDQEKIKQSPAGVRSQSIEDSVFFEKQTDSIQVLAQSNGSGSPAGTRTAIVRYNNPEQESPKKIRGDPKSDVDGTGGSRQDRGEGKRRFVKCRLWESRTRRVSRSE